MIYNVYFREVRLLRAVVHAESEEEAEELACEMDESELEELDLEVETTEIELINEE